MVNSGDAIHDDNPGDTHEDDLAEEFVAVVGMAGRFPESPDLDAFWDNLRQGRDCLHTFSDDELTELGIPLETVHVDNFVRRGTILPDRDRFDARFFGYTPKQAGITDPQARIFLETCYEALEHAGYNPFDPGCPVGVFAGSNPNDYALLLGVADPTDSLGAFDQLIGIDRDFIATRVSHRLGLTGPAMTIQTACSTSLVTVHAAVQSLLAYECAMALAGGVSINLRQGIGYFYQPGMILSPTGECRAFDIDAQGTTLGQGCGVAVLKRLADAEADGDHIMAVVRASAINNDGSNKIGYTAPSEDGQAEVISTAHVLAGVESDSIGYVETHGTGTLLGDPIEIAALTRAFKPGTTRRQYCAIGSAKTNFGHTDAAAGITGFMKAVLTLYHAEIPPSLHFSQPNPEIDFANSPFFVNTELRAFPSGSTPRRAGVSAFGIGGTNAHVVLEEPPRSTAPATADTGDRPRVLVLSGRTASAADQRVADVAAAVAGTGPDPTAVDFTLRHGRPMLDHRRAVVVGPDRPIDVTVAGGNDGTVVRGSTAELEAVDGGDPNPVWLFAGQGAQYPGMGLDLYDKEPVFRQAVDRVADHLLEPLGVDLRTVIFPPPDIETDVASAALRQTSMTQPALFAVEHAMAQLLRSWGQTPRAVVGHSIGEYAAAVEAGIMSWSDGATLVAERGRLMQSMEPGSMLSAKLPAADLAARLPPGAELAADNSTALSVASGPTDVIEALVSTLEADGVSAQILHTSHAFHSAMMDEAAERFGQVVAQVKLSPPTIPLMANVTGAAITDAEAVDPAFWAGQIRRPVRFTQCLQAAVVSGSAAFLELGPGRALSTFALGHEALGSPGDGPGDADGGVGVGVVAVPTMRHPRSERDDQVVLLEAMGRLWTVGLPVDWDAINGDTRPRRVPLPTYPFERTDAWLPPYRHVLALPDFGPPSPTAGRVARREPLDRWLYTPSWQRQPAGDHQPADGVTVVLAPAGGPGDRLVAELEAAGREVVELRPDPTGDQADPEQRLVEFFADLNERQVAVSDVIHGWTAAPGDQFATVSDLEHHLDLGVHSALACARGLSALSRRRPIRLDIVTSGAFSVTGSEQVRPDAAALLGPTKVIPLEYSGLTTRLVDLADGLASADDVAAAVAELTSTVAGRPPDEVVALRGGQRWTPGVAVRPTSDDGGTPLLRSGGRYLIVGGLGGVGLSIARFLAERYQASIVLTSRGGRPEATAADDPETSRRLALLDEIEQLADSLEVVEVDATDEGAMTAMVEQVEADGRPINGVIVAAGVADRAGAIHRRSRGDMTAAMASKVHGSLILERALGDRDLDFVLLSSSIAATLYHNRFAQVGYVTGNAFAEAFALRGRRQNRPTFTVAWDDWLDIGMSVRAAQDFSADFGTEVDLVDKLNSFSPADGVKLFDRALRTGEPVLLVSPTDLGQRIADDVTVVSPFLEQAMADDDDDDDAERDLVAGGTMTDLVTSVWSALLGFESFEPQDDFFDLGGDSLQAARMVDRLTRALGIEVPVDVVFDSSTLSRLVAVLEELQSSIAPTIERADAVGRVAPLGPAQRRFLDRAGERPHHFNVSVLLQPGTPLEPDHVESAVAAAVADHDALHLTLTSVDTVADGQDPQQMVAAGRDDLFTVVDLRSAPADEALAELDRSAAEVQQSLDLEHGPILRTVLYQLPDNQQRLLVTIHHLMSDRISLLLLMDVLDAEIQRLQAGGEPPPPRPVTSYLDWVDAQARVAGSDHNQLAPYWTERPWQLVSPLPVDHTADRHRNRNSNGAAVTVEIPVDQTQAAVERTGGRPDEIVLLALADVIGQWSGDEAVLIDVLGHGRRLPLDVDVSRSVGMFITYSPVLIGADRASADGADDRLDRLRADLEQGWTFDALRFYGPPEVRSALDALPRADVLFNYVGRAIATDGDALLTSTDEAKGPEVDPDGRRDHLIAVRADLGDDGGLTLLFVYSTLFHDEATIDNLAQQTAAAVKSLT